MSSQLLLRESLSHRHRGGRRLAGERLRNNAAIADLSSRVARFCRDGQQCSEHQRPKRERIVWDHNKQAGVFIRSVKDEFG